MAVGNGAAVRGATRVLYFTIVDVGRTDNGGGLCCRSHLRRLKADASISLTVVSAAPPDSETGVRRFLEELDVTFRFIALDDRGVTRGSSRRKADEFLAEHVGFLFEQTALNNPHVDGLVQAAVQATRPHALIIDYLPSFLFCPSVFSVSIPKIAVTLNREAEFYRGLYRAGLLSQRGLAARVSVARMARFERGVYRRCSSVVAIGANDLPRGLPKRVKRTLALAYLEPQGDGWRDSDSRTVFFVGNEAHYPNRLAIEWLARRFSPCLRRIDPSIGIKIVGARRPRTTGEAGIDNIDYLGVADRTIVEDLFRRADVLICPLENDFGSKFKILEAISFATPIVATRGAMSGAPFLEDLPTIQLAKPEAAAEVVAGAISDRKKLSEMSRYITERSEEFRRSQGGLWGRIVRDALR